LSGRRSVDDLVQAMGMSGISKRQVSRLCAELDDKVQTFLNRLLEGDWPYVWLDATYLKVREAGGIVSVAAIIAGRQQRWPARGAGSRHRPIGGRDLLDRVPAQARSPRPARRQAGDLRRPRRPQGRRHPCPARHVAALPVRLMRNLLAHAGRQRRGVVAALIATAFALQDAEATRA
jgi:putative transposase